MFNLFCRETKGCFNPTVRGEGGSGEGRGRRGCGWVGRVGVGWGGDFLRESACLSLLSLSHSRHIEEYTATGIMTSELCSYTTDEHSEGTWCY